MADSGGADPSASRRRFLSATIATGAAALAGCQSASDEGTDASNSSRSAGNESEEPDREDAEPTVADALFGDVEARFTPGQYQWNTTIGWFTPRARFGLFAQWTQYLYGEDRFYPHLVREWAHGDGELVLTLAEDFTWGISGEPVTAADLAFQLSVYAAADMTAARFVEGATARSENELVVKYPAELNDDLIVYTLLPVLADVPPSNWEETDWRADPTAVSIADPDPSGPLAHAGPEREDYPSKVTFPVRSGEEQWTRHALAGHFDWRGYEQVYYGGSEYPAYSLLASGSADGISEAQSWPGDGVELPQTVREFRIPSGFGMSLWFNHARDRWQDRLVREAFVQTINTGEILEHVARTGVRSRSPPTGLTNLARNRWLNDETLANFDRYDAGPERGEELLAEAGYAPEDLTVSIAYPQGWSDWAIAAQTVRDQLDAAGWNVEGDAHSGGPENVTSDGQFDVVAYPHTPSDRPNVHHPYFTLEHVLRGRPGDEGHFANYAPDRIEHGEGAVHVQEALDRLRTTSPREEQRPIVQRLARAVNADVPCAFVMEDVDVTMIDTDRFEIPEDSPHLRTHWPQWWLPKVDETLSGHDTPGLMKFVGDD